MSASKKLKSTPKTAKDLESNILARNQHFKAALNTIFQQHPDFRNVRLPDDETEEAYQNFLGQIRHISDNARRKQGYRPDISDVPAQYLPTVDIEPIYNPATMYAQLVQYLDDEIEESEKD